MRSSVVVLAVVMCLAVVPMAAQDAVKTPMTFTAFAVNLNQPASMGGQRLPSAGTLQITLDRLSTSEERATLVAAFKEGGQNALLRALQRVNERVGFIRTPSSLGWDLRFAYREVNCRWHQPHRHRHGPADGFPGRRAIVRASTISHSRSSRCTSTRLATAKAGWPWPPESRPPGTARRLSSRTTHFARRPEQHHHQPVAAAGTPAASRLQPGIRGALAPSPGPLLSGTTPQAG